MIERFSGLFRPLAQFRHRLALKAGRTAAALIGLGLLSSPQVAPAEETAVLDRADADPALWKLSDQDTTVYLFGTMHALKPDLVWFDDAVSEAFDASDLLAIEMVPPPLEEMRGVIAASAIYTDGTRLSDVLTDEQYSKLAMAAAAIDLPVESLEPMKPWFAAVTLATAPLQKLGYLSASGAEAVLQADAGKKGKPVEGLETFGQQMGFFSGLTQEQQIAFLMDGIETIDESKRMFEESERAWAVGDVAATARLINEGLNESPELYEALIAKRNRAWADWIQQRMAEPGTIFVAVGAGHLAGDDSVQAVLAKRGLAVERVVY